MREPPKSMQASLAYALDAPPPAPGMAAGALAGFIRWARRGVVVQGGRLMADAFPHDSDRILAQAEALGWISRQSYEPTREQLCSGPTPIAGARSLFSWEVSLSCPIYSEEADRILAGWGRPLESFVSFLAWVAHGAPERVRIPTAEELELERAMAQLSVAEYCMAGLRETFAKEPRKPPKSAQRGGGSR